MLSCNADTEIYEVCYLIFKMGILLFFAPHHNHNKLFQMIWVTSASELYLSVGRVTWGWNVENIQNGLNQHSDLVKMEHRRSV